MIESYDTLLAQEQERQEKKTRRAKIGGVLLTANAILGITNIGVGITPSVRIPFTSINISCSQAFGNPSQLEKTLPQHVIDTEERDSNAVRKSLESNLFFLGWSSELTIGKQPGSPIIGAHFGLAQGAKIDVKLSPGIGSK